MKIENCRFYEAYKARTDLEEFGDNALMLFALQLRFEIEDISGAAATSMVDGRDDKKVDLLHIDKDQEVAVIAQSYSSKRNVAGAPSNKASDLNTAMAWLLSKNINTLPDRIRPQACDLRDAINRGEIKKILIWFVHNLPESTNVKNELEAVEHTACNTLIANFNGSKVSVESLEVGINTIEEWYSALLTPILVNNSFKINISGGYTIAQEDWSAYSTAVPAYWLHELYQKYKTALFSANVRDYLGSRKADSNINNGIKTSLNDEPNNFWVYNNGITAIVNDFSVMNNSKNSILEITGISVVNGAQTTGAIGSLASEPLPGVLVPIRFIKCSSPDTILNIVKFNNSQNKVTAPDFRSNDSIQRRLKDEFEAFSNFEYSARRGGAEDIIRRPQNLLPSAVAGQVLAAFHLFPDIAYNKKTKIWEDDGLYARFFNEKTSAKHIFFSYSLLKTIENKKLRLMKKNKSNESLTEMENELLKYLRKRGSIILFLSGVSRCMEIILEKVIPNRFNIYYSKTLSLDEAIKLWEPIVDCISNFTGHLESGLRDGIKNTESINHSLTTFRNSVSAIKSHVAPCFASFSKHVNC